MVSATSSKVLVQTLLSRIRDFYEASILPFQYGFRGNKATQDAIFVAKQVMSKFTGEIWGSFVDLTAAYDHIPREMLWKVMRLRLGEKNAKIVDILESLYENTQAKLDGLDKLIDIEIGLRQGGQESCMIFNFWLDTVFRVIIYKIKNCFEAGTEPGIPHEFKINNECTNREQRAEQAQNGKGNTLFTKFADDIFCSARSAEELEKVMKIMVETFKEFGLTMSESKTQTMTWNTAEEVKSSKTLIKVDGFELENVRTFRYLGCVLSDNQKDDQFIKHQITSAYKKWHEYKNVFTDKRINLMSRVMIAESMVRSRLTYAVETQRLKNDQKKN